MNTNPFHAKFQFTRSGITIVEVLTSIVVAMIGVFGVMILIPFAVRQAQIGLDLDDATAMADNVISTFEINQYHRVNEQGELPWIDAAAPYNVNIPGVNPNDDPRGRLVIPGKPAVILNNDSDRRTHMFNRGPYWIDPLGIQAGLTTSNMFDDPTSFLVNDTVDAILPFRLATLVDMTISSSDNDGVPDFFDADADDDGIIDIYEDISDNPPSPIALSIPLARRLFRSNDDLQFTLDSDQAGVTIANNDPPQQVFDLGAGGTILRRQSRGEMTWSMIAVPTKRTMSADGGSVWNFNLHILVYKNRVLENPDNVAPGSQFDPRLKYQEVYYNPLNDPSGSTLNPLYSGGNVKLPAGIPIEIAKDEWVMLVNRINHENVLNAEPGFLHQVAFYRVIGTDSNTSTLTLDGPEFNFGVQVDPNNNPNLLSHTKTYIVYLPNVVNVYERTMRWEGASTWNQ